MASSSPKQCPPRSRRGRPASANAAPGVGGSLMNAGHLVDDGLIVAPGVCPLDRHHAPAEIIETRVIEVAEPGLYLDLRPGRKLDVVDVALVDLLARAEQSPRGQPAIG